MGRGHISSRIGRGRVVGITGSALGAPVARAEPDPEFGVTGEGASDLLACRFGRDTNLQQVSICQGCNLSSGLTVARQRSKCLPAGKFKDFDNVLVFDTLSTRTMAA